MSACAVLPASSSTSLSPQTYRENRWPTLAAAVAAISASHRNANVQKVPRTDLHNVHPNAPLSSLNRKYHSSKGRLHPYAGSGTAAAPPPRSPSYRREHSPSIGSRRHPHTDTAPPARDSHKDLLHAEEDFTYGCDGRIRGTILHASDLTTTTTTSRAGVKEEGRCVSGFDGLVAESPFGCGRGYFRPPGRSSVRAGAVHYAPLIHHDDGDEFDDDDDKGGEEEGVNLSCVHHAMRNTQKEEEDGDVEEEDDLFGWEHGEGEGEPSMTKGEREFHRLQWTSKFKGRESPLLFMRRHQKNACCDRPLSPVARQDFYSRTSHRRSTPLPHAEPLMSPVVRVSLIEETDPMRTDRNGLGQEEENATNPVADASMNGVGVRRNAPGLPSRFAIPPYMMASPTTSRFSKPLTWDPHELAARARALRQHTRSPTSSQAAATSRGTASSPSPPEQRQPLQWEAGPYILRAAPAFWNSTALTGETNTEAEVMERVQAKQEEESAVTPKTVGLVRPAAMTTTATHTNDPNRKSARVKKTTLAHQDVEVPAEEWGRVMPRMRRVPLSHAAIADAMEKRNAFFSLPFRCTDVTNMPAAKWKGGDGSRIKEDQDEEENEGKWGVLQNAKAEPHSSWMTDRTSAASCESSPMAMAMAEEDVLHCMDLYRGWGLHPRYVVPDPPASVRTADDDKEEMEEDRRTTAQAAREEEEDEEEANKGGENEQDKGNPKEATSSDETSQVFVLRSMASTVPAPCSLTAVVHVDPRAAADEVPPSTYSMSLHKKEEATKNKPNDNLSLMDAVWEGANPIVRLRFLSW